MMRHMGNCVEGKIWQLYSEDANFVAEKRLVRGRGWRVTWLREITILQVLINYQA